MLLPEVPQHVRQHLLPHLHQHPEVFLPVPAVQSQGLEAALRRSHQHRDVACSRDSVLAVPHHAQLRPDQHHEYLLCRPSSPADRQQGGHRADDRHGGALWVHWPARHYFILHLENKRLSSWLPDTTAKQLREAEGFKDGFHVCRCVLRVFCTVSHQLLFLHAGERKCHYRLLPERHHALHPTLLLESGESGLLLGSDPVFLYDFRVSGPDIKAQQHGHQESAHEQRECLIN